MVNAGERIRSETVNLAASPYLALVSRSTNLSIAHATYTAVSYTTETADTDGLYSTGTPNRFTIQHAGIYVAYFDWFLVASTCLRQLAMIYVNGTEYSRQEKRDDDIFGPGGQSLSSGLLSLSVGDYVQGYAYHEDGYSTARNLSSSHLSILYVSNGA